ncbi:PAAR domain-containing protein [Streptomyces vinaceus]|uniref:PAAR domain-containing protein n=1 Tax=Streptomyces vinaceus TaxID=1960 RepID=UPI0036A3EB57
MPPAARVGDMHTCPMQSPAVPPVPHVGGPIMPPGAVNVHIGGLPAATLGNMCTCVGPPDSIVKGSATVLIGGRPAARLGDTTAHGGIVVAGLAAVMIGG